MRFGLFAFGLGLVLGTIRVLIIVPQIGHGSAVLLELPIMLAACWWWSGRLVSRYRLPAREAAGLAGLMGFAVLMAGELTVGLVLMNQTLIGWILEFRTFSALSGLCAQLLACAMPALRWRPPSHSA